MHSYCHLLHQTILTGERLARCCNRTVEARSGWSYLWHAVQLLLSGQLGLGEHMRRRLKRAGPAPSSSPGESPCCLQVEKGSTAAVFGLGTIGLAVIDALQEAGARKIIGVDTDEGKFARAKEWGATDLINPKSHDKPIQVGAPPPAPWHDVAE